MRFLFNRRKPTMVTPAEAIVGRDRPAFNVPGRHAVLGTPLRPPFPDGMKTAVFGLMWGLRLVVMEDLDRLAPERGNAVSAAAINSLVKRGCKRGLGAVLAVQRLDHTAAGSTPFRTFAGPGRSRDYRTKRRYQAPRSIASIARVTAAGAEATIHFWEKTVGARRKP